MEGSLWVKSTVSVRIPRPILPQCIKMRLVDGLRPDPLGHLIELYRGGNQRERREWKGKEWKGERKGW